MSVAEFSIKRPITTVMFFVSLFVVGLIAAVRLPLEAFPAVTFPGIFLQLPYSGSTPEEVERTVLRPVEEAVSTMSGIKRMEGTARAEGASMFIMFSDWERDASIAASEGRERIERIVTAVSTASSVCASAWTSACGSAPPVIAARAVSSLSLRVVAKSRTSPATSSPGPGLGSGLVALRERA